jgi:hypothetical protein
MPVPPTADGAAGATGDVLDLIVVVRRLAPARFVAVSGCLPAQPDRCTSLNADDRSTKQQIVPAQRSVIHRAATICSAGRQGKAYVIPSEERKCMLAPNLALRDPHGKNLAAPGILWRTCA